jgi:hypothetical protein
MSQRMCSNRIASYDTTKELTRLGWRLVRSTDCNQCKNSMREVVCEPPGDHSSPIMAHDGNLIFDSQIVEQRVHVVGYGSKRVFLCCRLTSTAVSELRRNDNTITSTCKLMDFYFIGPCQLSFAEGHRSRNALRYLQPYHKSGNPWSSRRTGASLKLPTQ